MPCMTTYIWGEDVNYPLLIVAAHCVVLVVVDAADDKPQYAANNIDSYCTNASACCIRR